MTPNFDKLYETLMEDLSTQGTGMLANRAGSSTGAKPMGASPTPVKAQTPSVGANPATNLSGSQNTTNPQKPVQSGGQKTDFNQLISEPDDNKAATNILNHFTTNGIDFNDPNFAKTPEGQLIGKRITQNPKFADALNQAQQNLVQQATANKQKVFAHQP